MRPVRLLRMRNADAKSKMHRRLFVACGLSVLALVIAWLARPAATPAETPRAPLRTTADVVATKTSEPAPPQRGRAAPKPTAVAPAADAGAGKSADPAPLPPARTPNDIAIAQLKPLVEAGRTDAMRRLAAELRDCHFADRGSDEEIRQHAIDEILRREQRMHGGQKIANEIQWVEETTAGRIASRDGCMQVDADEAAHWLDWLDRAAAAGDTIAMIDYAAAALAGPRADPQSWSDDAVAQLKKKAGDYLQQALESGNCNALMEMERAYDASLSHRIFEPDAAMVYAIATARWDWYLENNPDADPDSVQSWLDYLAKAQAKVAEERRAAAQEQGDALYARYCRGRPET